MKQLQWVLQTNLINQEDATRLCDICKKHYRVYPIEVVPFSDALPHYITELHPTIFYGSTYFIGIIHKANIWKPGTFFNEQTFNYRAYCEHYKERMINYPARFLTIEWFINEQHSDEAEFFVRPIADNKDFAGQVYKFRDILYWGKNLAGINDHVTLATPIVVAEPFRLAHEWRLFIVNGKVISGSHYRKDFTLTVRPEVPLDVISFAEQTCTIWTPHSIFVMDVGECGDSYYVVECNCFNSSGFYATDMEAVIKAISEYTLERLL